MRAMDVAGSSPPAEPTCFIKALGSCASAPRTADDAKRTIDRLLAVQPNSSLKRSRQTRYRHSWMSDLHQEGLRKAGLPELPPPPAHGGADQVAQPTAPSRT